MNCLHPIKITDPTGRRKHILVPCGSCELCLKRRSDIWADRMRVEASQHKYVYFCTLTYSDDFVPQFRPEDTLEYQYFTDKQRDDVYNYVVEHEVSENYLVLRYKDIQDFIKRLRKYVSNSKLCPEEERSFRYVAVGEYGETTYRPHYHLIFYVDSDYLCSTRVRRRKDGTEIFQRSPFESYVRKAWQIPVRCETVVGKYFRRQIGRVDFQQVRDNAARYVSGYVTSYSYIPSLLRVSAFRPFIQASKSPVIGSFGIDKETVKKVIVEGLSQLPNKFGNEYDKNASVYLWRSIKDRLFPRIPCYASLNYEERRLLYGIAYYPWKDCTFKEFCCWLGNKDTDNSLVSTYRNLVCKALKIVDLEVLLDALTTDKDCLLRRSLVRLWRVSSLVGYNCSIYNFKLDEYVRYIDSYYSRLQHDGLLNQLKFEEEYSQDRDSRFLLTFVDPLARDSMSIESWEECKSSFGFAIDDDICDFDFWSVPENRIKIEKDLCFINVGKSYKRKMDYVIHKGLSNLGNL